MTYPIMMLLEQLWKDGKMEMANNWTPSPITVELCSVVECALNYMHMGNAAVIAMLVMNSLWIR